MAKVWIYPQFGDTLTSLYPSSIPYLNGPHMLGVPKRIILMNSKSHTVFLLRENRTKNEVVWSTSFIALFVIKNAVKMKSVILINSPHINYTYVQTKRPTLGRKDPASSVPACTPYPPCIPHYI